jgi:tetratricopeptide (TPR) repeat protein
MLRRPRHPLATIVPWVLLLGAIATFAARSYSLRFVQDDSYITYRYARNVVRGYGPVYNPGERVEGYTNFLWMMTLAFLGKLGMPFSTIIMLSQVLGVLSGIGVIIIFFLLLRRYSTGPPVLTPLALFLFAANGSFAYWCVSGMETGLFSLLLAASFYMYLRDDSARSRAGASFLLGLSALTRPEGALFFGVFLLHLAIRRLYQNRGHGSIVSQTETPRTRPAGLIGLLLPFIVVVAPFCVWRLGHYGYLFSNTFYAKTGLDAVSLQSGVRYLWDFLRAYGSWGLGLAIPVVVALWRRRKPPVPLLCFCLLAFAINCLYVVLVGGDVLRMYRFFVPLYFLFYFILSESLWLLPLPRLLVTAALAAVTLLTFWGPLTSGTTLRANRQAEGQLVTVLGATGSWLNENTRPDDWIACTTIGALGYFSDRNQVDMLGLTDAIIAHSPERILGARVYWKERKYNTRHVLERNPLYICFSTGDKPSAAAERALFLRARFRRGYFIYPISLEAGSLTLTYELFRAKPGADSIPIESPGVDAEFVDRYNAGINFVWAAQYDSAIAAFHRCCELSPSDFPYGFERLGRTYLRMECYDSAKLHLRRSLAVDDWCVNSHLALGKVFAREQNYDSAAGEYRAAVAFAPDYVAGYTNLSDVLIQAQRIGEAESVLVVCASRFPQAADPALRLARVRFLAGKFDAAVQDVAGLLKRYPGGLEALSLLDPIQRHGGGPRLND